MFDRCFPFMKALHVDWMCRKCQFSLISDSAVKVRMISPTHITLALHLLHESASLISSVIRYIRKAYFDEVWQNMSPGDGRLSHSLVGSPIMILYDASLTFTNFFSPPSGGLLQNFIALFFWMLLHNIWVLSLEITHCSPHSVLFLHNYCRWCGQAFSWVSDYRILFHLHHP